MSNTGIILWLQSFHTPVLDFLMKAITAIGGETFYTIVIPIIYWCIDKRYGFSLGTVFMVSNWINLGLKDLFRIPRPSHAVVRVLDSVGGYSFPSSHAQGTATFWVHLAAKIRRRWFTNVAIAVIVLVSLSRPYLGVHYPTDILAGAVLGTAIALIAYRLWADKLDIPLWAFVTVPVLLVLLDRTADSAKAAGFLAGLGIGYNLDRRFLGFRVGGALWQQAVRTAVGLALLLGVRVGLKLVLPAGIWFDYIRYTAIGVTGGYLLPWLFVTVGLMARDEGAGPT